MENRNANKLMLLTGIITGAAAMYFLKSETGQKTLSAIAEKGEELKTEIDEQSKTVIAHGKKILEETLKNGSSLLDSAKYKIDEQALNLKETANLTDFEKGVAKAIEKMKKA